MSLHPTYSLFVSGVHIPCKHVTQEEDVNKSRNLRYTSPPPQCKDYHLSFQYFTTFLHLLLRRSDNLSSKLPTTLHVWKVRALWSGSKTAIPFRTHEAGTSCLIFVFDAGLLLLVYWGQGLVSIVTCGNAALSLNVTTFYAFFKKEKI